MQAVSSQGCPAEEMQGPNSSLSSAYSALLHGVGPHLPKMRALFRHYSKVSEGWSAPDTFFSWFILRPLLISTQMLLKASFG